MKVKVKSYVKHKGQVFKQNGTVLLTLSAMYGEIENSIKTLQMLNNDVKIVARIEKQNIELGIFRIKSVLFDGDGESILKFETLTDYVEMDNMNKIMVPDEFKILMEADVELENGEE